jgi:thioredoxin-related protein
MRTLRLLLLLLPCTLFAQQDGGLKEYAFAKAEQLQQQEKRPYLVFLHTAWCKYCRGMEQNTFTDIGVVNALNSDYYFIPFNAESTEKIQFANRSFKYMPTGAKTGMHQLATALGTIDGKVCFPTVVILNPEFEIVYQAASFLNASQLLDILKGSHE